MEHFYEELLNQYSKKNEMKKLKQLSCVRSEHFEVKILIVQSFSEKQLNYCEM